MQSCSTETSFDLLDGASTEMRSCWFTNTYQTEAWILLSLVCLQIISSWLIFQEKTSSFSANRKDVTCLLRKLLITLDAARQHLLCWPTHIKIIKGVSRGLLYFHHDSRLTVIHRDLKTSNILLDADMNPNISDFAMASIFCANRNEAITNRVVGT
jgi:serine/threonine protein kinase